MDMQLYLFDWALLGKNQLTDPKTTINCNNISKVEVKKELSFVVTEKKTGLLARSQKYTLKAHTQEDLEAWLQLLTPAN